MLFERLQNPPLIVEDLREVHVRRLFVKPEGQCFTAPLQAAVEL